MTFRHENEDAVQSLAAKAPKNQEGKNDMENCWECRDDFSIAPETCDECESKEIREGNDDKLSVLGAWMGDDKSIATYGTTSSRRFTGKRKKVRKKSTQRAMEVPTEGQEAEWVEKDVRFDAYDVLVGEFREKRIKGSAGGTMVPTSQLIYQKKEKKKQGFRSSIAVFFKGRKEKKKMPNQKPVLEMSSCSVYLHPSSTEIVQPLENRRLVKFQGIK